MTSSNAKEEEKKSESQLGKAQQATKDGTPVLEAAPKKINRNVIMTIPEEVAKRYRMAVFERRGDLIKVAMVDPQDLAALNALRFIAEKEKLTVDSYLATADVFDEIIENYVTAEKAVEEVVQSFQGEDLMDELDITKKKEKVKESIQDAPVAKLVQVVIRHAIDGKASDVHIEPVDENYRVRFRVDGILHSSLVLPAEVGRAVISRIKILSNLKIDEKRKPQDGRFKINDGGESIDFRVSTLPVVDGEKVAIRVLIKDDNLLDLGSLGLIGKNGEIVTRKIRDPYGIILITGPTGSGKSTTLYSFLNILNKEERNIVTLEDPVEYFAEGINQSQIRPEIGYTFASGLRSILRQDPNVIMVGEIRDNETAELAIHAALTGHLVFSTLHTNDAIGAIPRMMDMNVEPFLLSSSLRAVAAQRLVRRICDKCKTEDTIPPATMKKVEEVLKVIRPEEFKNYGVDISKGVKFFKGAGCEFCGQSGFKGRFAVYEVVEITDKIQALIPEKDSEIAIRKEATAQGMMSIKQDGLLKALQGGTSLAEVERVTEGKAVVDED